MALPTPSERSTGKTYSRKAAKMIRNFFITNDSDSIVMKFDHTTDDFKTKLHKLVVENGAGSQFRSDVSTSIVNNNIDFGFDSETVFDVEYPTVNIGTEQASQTFVQFSTNTTTEDSDSTMIIVGTANIQGTTYFRSLSEVFLTIDSEIAFNNNVTFTTAFTVDSDVTGGSIFDSEINAATFNIVNLRAGDSEGANGYYGDSDSDRIGQFGHRFRIATKEIIYDSDKHLRVHDVTGASLIGNNDSERILFFSQRN